MAKTKKKVQPTLADYVTVALSPVLIMALVGSLVFFLLEVLYVGQYSGRLQWTLFFFVFAMVLIARIAIEQGDGKAGLYGIGLAVAVFLALQAFVEYPGGSAAAVYGWAINLGLMAVIWWCAHQLTWDCTYIDETVDVSGKGVLEAAGLDQEAPPPAPDEDAPEEADGDKRRRPMERPGLVGWWDRYGEYREAQRKKPHTPGVWVVYFSLAALPLFGLGQSLIPPDADERRRYAFWLMVCYVGSGLALLVTTSFLGLRRYLRQRKLKMPKVMTAMWLSMGGGLIAVLLLLGALLPRPYGEYQLIHFTPLGSKERGASRYAMKRDSAGKGNGRSSTDPARDDQKGEPGAGTKRDSKDGAPGKSGSASGKSGQSSSKSKSGQSSNRGGKEGRSRSNDSSKAKDPSNKDDRAGNDADKDQDDDKRRDEEKEKGDSSGSGSSSERDEASSSRSSSSSFWSKFTWLGTLLKWLVFAAIALLVLFFVLRSGLQFLANFTNWARRLLDALRAWWAGLFGGKIETQVTEEADAPKERVVRPRPFAHYSNPFDDGRAEQMSPDDLTRYSFEALQSWAWEQHLERQAEETPLEFARRLGDAVPSIDKEALRLASLYARLAYARTRLPRASVEVVREFWQTLDAAEARPASG